jgi:hypothetical protein
VLLLSGGAQRGRDSELKEGRRALLELVEERLVVARQNEERLDAGGLDAPRRLQPCPQLVQVLLRVALAAGEALRESLRR